MFTFCWGKISCYKRKQIMLQHDKANLLLPTLSSEHEGQGISPCSLLANNNLLDSVLTFSCFMYRWIANTEWTWVWMIGMSLNIFLCSRFVAGYPALLLAMCFLVSISQVLFLHSFLLLMRRVHNTAKLSGFCWTWDTRLRGHKILLVLEIPTNITERSIKGT